MQRDDMPDFDEHLRRAADAESPAFSSELHARVMRRVVSVPVPRAGASWRTWGGRMSIAAAACLVVVAVNWVFQGRERSNAGRTVIANRITLVDPLEPIEIAAAQSRALEERFHAARYAYLDQDVRTFVTYVRETLPPLPDR